MHLDLVRLGVLVTIVMSIIFKTGMKRLEVRGLITRKQRRPARFFLNVINWVTCKVFFTHLTRDIDVCARACARAHGLFFGARVVTNVQNISTPITTFILREYLELSLICSVNTEWACFLSPIASDGRFLLNRKYLFLFSCCVRESPVPTFIFESSDASYSLLWLVTYYSPIMASIGSIYAF